MPNLNRRSFFGLLPVAITLVAGITIGETSPLLKVAVKPKPPLPIWRPTPGQIFPFSGKVFPEGYLACHGQALNRRFYALLFEQIGTTYGVGDGETTFNVPDLRGRALYGRDTHDALIEAELPTHRHAFGGNYVTAAVPAHSHSYSVASACGIFSEARVAIDYLIFAG